MALTPITCPDCNGAGVHKKLWGDLVDCWRCWGAGEVEVNVALSEMKCPDCDGYGYGVTEVDETNHFSYFDCRRCMGAGEIEVQRVRSVAHDPQLPEL